MDTEYTIVIPARGASERLQGKPLLDVGGQTLLQRVWACAKSSNATEVVIATDQEDILETALGFGAKALMTDPGHPSGSDRIAECIGLLGLTDDSFIVNLQGDEPEMPPECLDQVAQVLAADEEAVAASLYQLIVDPVEVRDPNAVKVVVDHRGRALYFSRSVIPAFRQWNSIEEAVAGGCSWKRHIGLYAYRAGALKRFTRLDPSPLEASERLEQLRILESGGAIAMAPAIRPVPAGVDTPEDLRRVRNAFR